MRRLLMAAGLSAVVATGATRVSGQVGSPPVVDGTIGTIQVTRAGGVALPANIGVQGIALSKDRSKIYVSEGWQLNRWSSLTQKCEGNQNLPSPGQSGAVGVFSTATLGHVADIPLQAGFPIHLSLDGATGRIYVASSPEWAYAIDGTSVVQSRQLGAMPHDIGIDESTGKGLASNTGTAPGQRGIALLTLSSLAVDAQVDSGGFGPHKVAVDPVTHVAYISHADHNKVTVASMTTGQVLRTIVTGLDRGGAQNAIDLTRQRLFIVGKPVGVSNQSEVRRIDLGAETVSTLTVRLPSGGHGMRVDPVTGLLWVVLEENAAVSIIDPDTMTERARMPVGKCPYYLDIDAESRRAYVTNGSDNTISVLDMTKVPTGSPSSGAPAAPTGLQASTVSGGIALSWTAGTGGGAPTGHQVQATAGADTGFASPFFGPESLGTAGTSVLLPVPPGITGTYRLRIRATNASGESAWSAGAPVTLGGGGGGSVAPPATPTGVAASVTGGTLTVTWATVSGASGYSVEFRQTAGGPLVATAPATTPPLQLPLPPGVTGTYLAQVKASNSAGTSPLSDAASFTIGGCTAPASAPATLTAQVTGGQAVVQWAAVSGATSYVLQAGAAPDTSGYFNQNVGPTTQVSAPVPPGFTAHVRVQAVNLCGSGPFSPSVLLQ